MTTKYDFSIRLLLIGDSNVGKSSILTRFVEDTFNSSFITTVGIDFRTIFVHAGDKTIRVQIWDTAGQERFKGIMPAYYRGVQGVVLVYDVTNPASFNNIKDWVAEIDNNCTRSPIASMLIGNKIDLVNERKVSTFDGQDLAMTYDLKFSEVSACNTDESVHVAIYNLIDHIINRVLYEKKTLTPALIMAPEKPPPKSSSGCMGYLPTKQQIKNKFTCCINPKFQSMD
jgi:small GTP-binding protein